VLRIGIVDTGVNAWHSHVRGAVAGCRIHADADGRIHEDADHRDLVGHGTAVAGVIREALPAAEIFAVRVFDAAGSTYPSLVARGILRAAASGCAFVNLSLCVAPGAGSDELAQACRLAQQAGCVLVASADARHAGWPPASLPGVYVAVVDDTLPPGRVRREGARRIAASGSPRDLASLPREANLWGSSFACARALVHLVHAAGRASPRARRFAIP
jgi:subtilisin family serine protease